MKTERSGIPDWAKKERENDLQWIRENLGMFWSAAQVGFTAQSRGALLVDTTAQDEAGSHPFGYLTQSMVEDFGDSDIERMVRGYDPEQELVIVLWKPCDRTSTYRVKPLNKP